MDHSEMDSQKDTPHPIAQYNTISNTVSIAQRIMHHNFMIKALILLPKVGTADSYIKGTTHLTREQLFTLVVVRPGVRLESYTSSIYALESL